MNKTLWTSLGVLVLASVANAQITVNASTANVLRFQNFPIQQSNAAVTNTVTASLNLPVLQRATIKTTVDGSYASTEVVNPINPDWTEPSAAMAKASSNFVGYAFVVERPDAQPIPTWGEAIKTVSTLVPFVKMSEKEAEASEIPLPKPIKSGRAIVITDIYGNQLAAYTGPMNEQTLFTVATTAIRSQERMLKLDQELNANLARAETSTTEGKRPVALAAYKGILKYKGYSAVSKAKSKYDALMTEGTAEVVSAMKTYLAGARTKDDAQTARTSLAGILTQYPQTDVAKLATEALAVVAGGKVSPALEAALSAPTTQPVAQQVAKISDQ